MKLVRYSVMSILVLGLLVPVQAASLENRIRLKGGAMCALGGLTAMRYIERSSSLDFKKVISGMGILTIIFGLHNRINAQKIAKKLQQEQTA